jgi:long-chain acyl-CoA synthetase
MATLKKASAVRRALAMGLLAAATARTRAQRILNGVDLRYATSAAPFTELFKAWVLSRLLAPLQLLFRKLVASKVRDALGIRGIVVSGGGSLAAHLDDFYECIGLPVINGYGLTETSPVLACRSTTAPAPGGNVRGSVGRPTPGTQLRVVDPVTYKDLPDGQQGLILARGPGVMQGYYSNEAATAAAFSAGDGWLDTGDLGWKAPENVASSSRMAGCIVLTGRAKDTIVLSSGENVEPQPIEDAICASPYVKFAILVGQNRRGLGVLVVADEDAMAAVSEARGGDSLTQRERQELLRQAVAGAGTGRPAWEHVHHFVEVERPFSFEDGTLTRTMKPRRAEIMSSYAAEVAQLEAKLR